MNLNLTEKAGLLEARHPVATGVMLAAIAAYSAWTMYQTGVTIGTIRAIRGERARAASEALGG